MTDLPKIKWIKNEYEIHKFYEKGHHVFLMAIQIQTGLIPMPELEYQWDFDVVHVFCAEDSIHVNYRGTPCGYDTFPWNEFEYFSVIEGYAPGPEPTKWRTWA